MCCIDEAEVGTCARWWQGKDIKCVVGVFDFAKSDTKCSEEECMATCCTPPRNPEKVECADKCEDSELICEIGNKFDPTLSWKGEDPDNCCGFKWTRETIFLWRYWPWWVWALVVAGGIIVLCLVGRKIQTRRINTTEWQTRQSPAPTAPTSTSTQSGLPL